MRNQVSELFCTSGLKFSTSLHQASGIFGIPYGSKHLRLYFGTKCDTAIKTYHGASLYTPGSKSLLTRMSFIYGFMLLWGPISVYIYSNSRTLRISKENSEAQIN